MTITTVQFRTGPGNSRVTVAGHIVTGLGLAIIGAAKLGSKDYIIDQIDMISIRDSFIDCRIAGMADIAVIILVGHMLVMSAGSRWQGMATTAGGVGAVHDIPVGCGAGVAVDVAAGGIAGVEGPTVNHIKIYIGCTVDVTGWDDSFRYQVVTDMTNSAVISPIGYMGEMGIGLIGKAMTTGTGQISTIDLGPDRCCVAMAISVSAGCCGSGPGRGKASGGGCQVPKDDFLSGVQMTGGKH